MSEEVKPAASAATTPTATTTPAAAADKTPAAAPGAEPAKPAAATPVAETKPAETKTDSKPAAEKPVVPEKYDLKLPDGSLLNPAHVDKIAAEAKAQGLSNEQAQKMLERDSQVLSDFQKNQTESLKTRQQEWVTEVTNDKELGGEALKRNTELASRVINRFGTDSLKKHLNDTGLGNHPDLVRFVVRIGKAMSEDQLVLPGAQSGGKKSVEELFYGKTGE